MAKKNAGSQDPVTHANRLAAMLKVLNPGDGMAAEDSYSADWELDVTDRRLRTILRPSLILDNLAIQELPEEVAGCHDSVALLPGFRLEQLIRGGNRAFEEFFGLAAGRDLTLPSLVTGKSLIKPERGEIRCILIADPGEIARALEVFPGFANRVVLVDASLPTTTCEWEESNKANDLSRQHFLQQPSRAQMRLEEDKPKLRYQSKNWDAAVTIKPNCGGRQKLENSFRGLASRRTVHTATLLMALLVTSCSKPAPLGTSFRRSAIDSAGLVLQVRNTSSKSLFCARTATNETNGQTCRYSFSLAPSGSIEIGIMEAGWSFKSGESVQIDVEGHRSLSFKVP